VSLVLTIVLVWIAASVVVAIGWMVAASYVRRRRNAHERAVREWRQLLTLLAHPRRPRLPRQRDRQGPDHQDPGHEDPDRRDRSA
jgi:hypothetical protein